VREKQSRGRTEETLVLNGGQTKRRRRHFDKPLKMIEQKKSLKRSFFQYGTEMRHRTRKAKTQERALPSMEAIERHGSN